MLLEDRDEHVSVGRSGAVLMEDVETETRPKIGKTGAILKEDRDSNRYFDDQMFLYQYAELPFQTLSESIFSFWEIKSILFLSYFNFRMKFL